MLVWSGRVWQNWSADYNLVTGFSAKPPLWEHPVWELARLLPDGAVPIASKDASIAISNHTVSYTFDESLQQKAPRWGLAAGTHLIADRRRSGLLSRAMALDGAEIIAESSPFVLVRWSPEAVDALASEPLQLDRVQPWLGPYRRAHNIPGVAPHEQRIAVQPGSFPVIQLR